MRRIRDCRPDCRRWAGFTLIELAIVLFCISLLLVGMLGPLRTRVESAERQQAVVRLDEIKEAIYGFAISNGRLPCPDLQVNPAIAGYGLEEANCPLPAQGFLPSITLGVPIADPWGNRYVYRVTPEFTVQSLVGGPCAPNDGDLDLCDAGTIAVNSRLANENAVPVATAAPAVVLSHGANQSSAVTADGRVLPQAPLAGADEAQNGDGDSVPIWARTYTKGSNPCDDAAGGSGPCEFDDIVVWLSSDVLKNKLIEAGQLPRL